MRAVVFGGGQSVAALAVLIRGQVRVGFGQSVASLPVLIRRRLSFVMRWNSIHPSSLRDRERGRVSSINPASYFFAAGS
jgi:hypothetical protein